MSPPLDARRSMTGLILPFAVGLVCLALVLSSSGWAEYRHCDRSKRYESLSEQGQQELQRGTLFMEVNKHTGSAYHMGYVYTLPSQ
jgi:hypothetical protein